MKESALFFAVVAAVGLNWLNCSGTSDEVVTGTRASARIYEVDGRNPAAGVTVKMFEADAVDGRSVSQQTTTSAGVYSLDDLPKGTYNVWAQRDSLVCFQNNVSVTENGVSVRNDTLECASSVTGIVGVQPQDDPLTVTIQVVGLDKYLRNTDKNGFFTMKNMAQGDYSLLLKSTLPNYTPTTVDITVNACVNDTIEDTLRLTFTGISIVNNVRVSYDTAYGTVRLAWAATDDRDFQDYVIYRDFFDSAAYSTSPLAATGDTCFIDTVFDRQLTSGVFSAADTSDYHLRYRVAIRDNVSAVGPTYKFIGIVAVSPTKVRAAFTFSSRHAVKGFVSGAFRDPTTFGSAIMAGAASVNDTVIVLVRVVDATRALVKLQWRDSVGSVIRTADCAATRGMFIDSLSCSWSKPGVHRITCAVADDAGAEWIDTARIGIVADIPKINVFVNDSMFVADTSGGNPRYAFGDTVPLHLDASDRYGSIVKVAWGFGVFSAESRNTMTFDTFAVAPDTAPLLYPVVASITDDDGNAVADTMKISLSLFAPATYVAAFKPRMYQAGVAFNNKMWIFGGVGITQETPRTSYTSYSDAWNSENGRVWTQATSNAPGRSGHAMVEFKGKLWLIGGYASSWGAYKNDVWCSADGVTWTCVKDSAAFAPRIYHSAIVFNGRIWVIGGLTRTSAVNDVWSSVDGTQWEKTVDSIAFPARCYHASVVYNEKLWVIGGRDASYNPVNDVWSSSDGALWIRVTADAGFSPRQGHTGLVYNGKIWIIGGYGFGTSDMANDIWNSTGGADWVRIEDSNGLKQRAFHSSVVFRNRMWIIAGMTGSTTLANDVWRSGAFAK